MKVKWNEELLNRCLMEDKLPSELMTEQTQPANRWEVLKALLTGNKNPPTDGATVS